MNKKLQKLLPALFLITLFSVNCSKDKDPEPKSKTTFLTQKDWLVSKFEEKLNNGPYVDDFPNWSPCEKDDKYVFETGNTYEYNEGATKCNASDPQIIYTGSWALTDNETKILFGSSSFTIDQLDDNTLIISATEVLAPDTYTLKVTFTH